MNPPGFWRRDGIAARLLRPASAVVAAHMRRRLARPGFRAPVPVICCGGATVGGAGKTTLALAVMARLRARGVAAHFLTRGHGGRARGPWRVDPGRDGAEAVGDEALLLAAAAPAWVSRDRAAGARAACAAGAAAIVMDDGLQNPGLARAGLLAIDGATGFGNGRVLPAGPLREPVAAAAGRCRAAVLVGEDRTGALAALPPGLSVLRAVLRATDPPPPGAAVLPLAGIAFPGKFHATLREAGLILAGAADFPDHHRYAACEIEAVLERAARAGAIPVTTPKDAARLPPALRARFRVVGAALEWADPEALDRVLDSCL